MSYSWDAAYIGNMLIEHGSDQVAQWMVGAWSGTITSFQVGEFVLDHRADFATVFAAAMYEFDDGTDVGTTVRRNARMALATALRTFSSRGQRISGLSKFCIVAESLAAIEQIPHIAANLRRIIRGETAKESKFPEALYLCEILESCFRMLLRQYRPWDTNYLFSIRRTLPDKLASFEGISRWCWTELQNDEQNRNFVVAYAPMFFFSIVCEIIFLRDDYDQSGRHKYRSISFFRITRLIELLVAGYLQDGDTYPERYVFRRTQSPFHKFPYNVDAIMASYNNFAMSLRPHPLLPQSFDTNATSFGRVAALPGPKLATADVDAGSRSELEIFRDKEYGYECDEVGG